MPRQMIAPGFVEDALACLHRRGLDAGPVLRQAGLPDWRGGPVTPGQYGALWLALAEALDDEFFGLAARPMRPGSFTLLCHAVLHAVTLDQALRRALRFLRVALDAPYGKLLAGNGEARIVLADAGPPRPAFAYRTFWMLLMGVACWLVGRRIPLRRIEFAGPCPALRTDYAWFFGAPVQFQRPASRLVFDAAYLRLPVIQSERSLKTFLRGAPANLLLRYPHETGWTARIRAYLKSVPAADWPVFDALARHLGSSPATLRRRLLEEGQSFAAIKDEMRSALAQSLLRQNELNVSGIAGRLGFSEPSAFHRAFRKWTGKSPGAVRQEWRRIAAGGDGQMPSELDHLQRHN